MAAETAPASTARRKRPACSRTRSTQPARRSWPRKAGEEVRQQVKTGVCRSTRRSPCNRAGGVFVRLVWVGCYRVVRDRSTVRQHPQDGRPPTARRCRRRCTAYPSARCVICEIAERGAKDKNIDPARTGEQTLGSCPMVNVPVVVFVHVANDGQPPTDDNGGRPAPKNAPVAGLIVPAASPPTVRRVNTAPF